MTDVRTQLQEGLSPEQASGERTLDARSDVYSLASVLYEMLAGEPPFTGPTMQVIIVKRLTEQPPSVRASRPAPWRSSGRHCKRRRHP